MNKTSRPEMTGQIMMMIFRALLMIEQQYHNKSYYTRAKWVLRTFPTNSVN